MAGQGMKMLVAHLQEYKDTTANEIACLQSKIAALCAHHELVTDELEERQEDIKDHDAIIDNLQSVNSRKYRAEERGDWQTLVESLNEDRGFLHKDLEDIEEATAKLDEEASIFCHAHAMVLGSDANSISSSWAHIFIDSLSLSHGCCLNPHRLAVRKEKSRALRDKSPRCRRS